MRSPARWDDAAAGDRGQAAVETALVLPVLVMVLLGVVQVVLVTRDQLAAVHAAREGARAAAVAPGPGAASPAASAATGLDPARLRVAESRSGDVRVTVTYRSPTEVPLVGWLLPDLDLTATAVMRLEP